MVDFLQKSESDRLRLDSFVTSSIPPNQHTRKPAFRHTEDQRRDMADSKQGPDASVQSASSPSISTSSASQNHQDAGEAPASQTKDGVTLFRLGEAIQDGDAAHLADVDGFDVERMRDRTLLTAEEEKALMRKVDWRIMTMCSLLFLMKNLDADNISNARIMNRGTGRNIMTQLGMTSDEYNLLNVLYYVRDLYPRCSRAEQPRLTGR